MASDSSGWPVLEERRALARAHRGRATRRRPRPAWLLAALAFVCGGLVSAAIFTIGWRHQAQRNTAAETALAAATARNHRLAASLASERRTAADEHRAAAKAKASAKAAAKQLSTAAIALAAQADATRHAAAPLSGGVGGLSSSAAKIASELKTLTSYLTTTPASQLDAGYVASQTAYLGQQLNDLQSRSGDLAGSVSSFEAAARKLARLASSLSHAG